MDTEKIAQLELAKEALQAHKDWQIPIEDLKGFETKDEMNAYVIETLEKRIEAEQALLETEDTELDDLDEEETEYKEPTHEFDSGHMGGVGGRKPDRLMTNEEYFAYHQAEINKKQGDTSLGNSARDGAGW